MNIKHCSRNIIWSFKAFCTVSVVYWIIYVSKIHQITYFPLKYSESISPISSEEDASDVWHISTDGLNRIYPFESMKNSYIPDSLSFPSGRLDKSGRYEIYDNIIIGDQYKVLSKEYDVTLASFATMDKLYWVLDVVR